MSDDMTGKIMNMLSNPEMMKKISEAVGSLNQSGEQSNTSSTPDDKSLDNIQNIISTINSAPDRRINLLNALKPYMRSSRAASVDRAVQMLRLTKLGEILKK